MNLRQDIRHALRSFRNAPSFTAIAALTLALGIGANTAIFSVVRAVLLRPLPYSSAERLVTLRQNQSLLDLQDIEAASKSFDGSGGAVVQPLDLTGGEEPVQLKAALVTRGLFDVLGARPVIGRTFTAAEDAFGGPPTVVLGNDVWKTRFGGETSILGRAITLSGTAYTIIGVFPAGFRLPERDGDVYVPLRVALPLAAQARGVHFLRTVLRLKDGVSLAAAQADLDRVAKVLEANDPVENKGRTLPLLTLRERLAGQTRPALLILLGAAGVVLLIASANFANLLLARALARRKELVIRAALGAGRGRLVAQMLTESVVLALIGGVLGLMLAPWLLQLLLALRPKELLELFDIRIDASVLAFTFGVSLGTGALFGLLPAFIFSRRDVSAGLAESGRGGTAGVGRSRLAGLLVVVELALALVLVVGAGLLGKSFLRLHATQPGFLPEGLTTMRIELPETHYREVEKQVVFRQKLRAALEGTPDFELAIVSELPLDNNALSHNAVVEGRPEPAPGDEPELWSRSVAGDYFRTMRIPLLSGRDFTPQDRAGAPLVAIVNAAFQREYFPGGDAVGKRVRWARERTQVWITIVGVVGDVRHFGLENPEQSALYSPYDQLPQVWKRWMYLVVRSRADAASVERVVKSALRKVDAQLPVTQVRTMTSVLGSSLAPQRFSMALIGLFGLLALGLAATGLYGVLSHAVTQRTREIGIRVALGAAQREVLALVVKQGMRLALAGIAFGVLGAIVATRLLRSLLYGVSPTDPLTYAALAAVLSAVALVACAVPAFRASRVDPIVALREE